MNLIKIGSTIYLRRSYLDLSYLDLSLNMGFINFFFFIFWDKSSNIGDFHSFFSCKDKNEKCPFWASTGQCASDPIHMNRICPESCGSGCINIDKGLLNYGSNVGNNAIPITRTLYGNGIDSYALASRFGHDLVDFDHKTNSGNNLWLPNKLADLINFSRWKPIRNFIKNTLLIHRVFHFKNAKIIHEPVFLCS